MGVAALNRLLPALAIALSLTVGAASAQPAASTPKSPDVVDSSFVTSDGARNLRQSIVIDAPVAVLWSAFVDPAQFKRWNSPVAAIDLRVGGSLEASYDPAKAIG